MSLYETFFYHSAKIIPVIVFQRIRKELIFVILPKYLNLVLKVVKNHVTFQYNLLSCVSGIDFSGNNYRFSVVYDFLSLTFNQRLRLKTFLNEVTPVESITNLYSNANWWEREVWDMYGIFFEKHPDLRRILSDYGFEGFPMRKDFPLYGYIELRYDENVKRVVAEPVELAQEFRYFDFETPW